MGIIRQKRQRLETVMPGFITQLSPESHALITEVNRAQREGWMDMTARDGLIAFYLANTGRYAKIPSLAQLMEDYANRGDSE